MNDAKYEPNTAFSGRIYPDFKKKIYKFSCSPHPAEQKADISRTLYFSIKNKQLHCIRIFRKDAAAGKIP